MIKLKKDHTLWTFWCEHLLLSRLNFSHDNFIPIEMNRSGHESRYKFWFSCLYFDTEYAYSSKATTKCDVYSFGVVLMELITGKKPVEAEFGENKNIIYWVSNKVDTREGAMEVLDAKLSESFKDEMIQVLRVAVRCTYKNPVLRPTMKEVVQLLKEADPCKFDSSKSSQYKTNGTSKETSNNMVTKIKSDRFELWLVNFYCGNLFGMGNICHL